MLVNELILDRVRSLTFSDPTINADKPRLWLRLTSIEEPSINVTAEGDEVTDAVGALITTLYRAKRATVSGTNSLFSLDLAAAQFGAEKEVAKSNAKIVDYTYEILDVDAAAISAGTVDLTFTPINNSQYMMKYIYAINNNEVGTPYEMTSGNVDATHFKLSGSTITLPTGMTAGTKLYCEYNYETEKANKVSNMAANFPKMGTLVIYAYFRDKCNENLLYSGKIIAQKTKINPESIDLALSATGKHPFEFIINKDYCGTEGDDELFSIIISDETTAGS